MTCGGVTQNRPTDRSMPREKPSGDVAAMMIGKRSPESENIPGFLGSARIYVCMFGDIS